MSASTARTESEGSSNVQSGTRPIENVVYLYDIRKTDLRNLCEILDEQDIWQELATKMGYGEDVIGVSMARIEDDSFYF